MHKQNDSLGSVRGPEGEGAAPSNRESKQDPSKIGESQEEAQEISSIDWDKVGKIYKPDSAIDHIIGKEMGRLTLALDAKIDLQDQVNEEKFKKKK